MLSQRYRPPSLGWEDGEAALLANVDRLIAANQAAEAVKLIGFSYLSDPRIANALAVCHLRLGNTVRALRLIRNLSTYGTSLRSDVPIVFRTNLAAAYLAAGDATECIRTLDEIGEEENPTVRRLRAAAERALPRTTWERFLWWLGFFPGKIQGNDGQYGELWEAGTRPDSQVERPAVHDETLNDWRTGPMATAICARPAESLIAVQ